MHQSTAPVGIIAVNVTFLMLKDLTLVNCAKQHEVQVVPSYFNYGKIKLENYSATLILHECKLTMINHVAIIVEPGRVGILVVTTIVKFITSNVSFMLNCSANFVQYNQQTQINGILIFQHNVVAKNNTRGISVEYHITDIHYIENKACSPFSKFVIGILLFKDNHNLYIATKNTTFEGLHNTSALYYYGGTCGINIHTKVDIQNVNVSNNVGNSLLSMFRIILYNHICYKIAFSKEQYCKQQDNGINFIRCNFMNNTDMRAMIFVAPASTRAITGYINVLSSTFSFNKNLHFINSERSSVILWHLTNFISIVDTNISSNYHYNGNSLISIMNGAISINSSTIITHNQYYENILKLHLSTVFIKGNVKISNNFVRHVLKAFKDGSYMAVMDNTTVAITNNTVHSIVRQDQSFGIQSQHICRLQFYTIVNGTLDNNLDDIEKMFKISIIDNTYMISKEFLGEEKLLINCQWIVGSAFYTAKSEAVYNKTLHIRNTVIHKNVQRPIPLSICPCSDDVMNCSLSDLGELSPGQTLHVNFMVSERWLNKKNPTTTLVVRNSAENDCIIVDASQLSQTHFNHSCNQYRYTIWPRDGAVRECKLYIGLSSMPEMFFVQIKPCPKGFVLQEGRHACYCDPKLNSKFLPITTCSLDDEAVFRPANSWISASTVNNTHSYRVSSYCPFDYCLPYASHLNLSNPDSQCQFNRTGVMCGQCKHGLSAVFGSSQCENCSNVYLLISIPIATAGIVLVIMLFIFNLTVINGTINTFIFYVNIISINISIISPVCYPVVCTLLSFLNLDLGTTVCFYNGMDDYAKMWLQIVFPAYLITIAIVLIITSRYFTIIQKMTAQRALPVLATLFLLSYTKVLSTVCNALFWYSELIHLPSNTSKLVWFVDTSSPVFGVKFLMMFIIYLLLLLLLLPFNVVLLCRRLSVIRYINTFKPLLDTYFGPYKDKHYYWMGLQLLTRAVINGFSALNRDDRIIAISILLALLLCMQGFVQPFKNKFNNVQELLVLFNLLVVHIVSCHESKIFDTSIAQIFITIALAYFVIAVNFLCCAGKLKIAVHCNKL